MIKLLILSLVLTGQIYAENTNGRIGVKMAGRKIIHVYNYGTNIRGLIYEGDEVLESDGKPGESGFLGPAGVTIHIKIKRQGQIKEFDIERVDVRNVKD